MRSIFGLGKNIEWDFFAECPDNQALHLHGLIIGIHDVGNDKDGNDDDGEDDDDDGAGFPQVWSVRE